MGAVPPSQKLNKPKVTQALPFGIFGSLEFKTNATAGMGGWQHVQGLIASEQKLYSKCDAGDKACPAYLATWRKNLKSWSAESTANQLTSVNAWVNQQIRYTDDKAVYNKADYWASPAQSLKGRGDCEDYVIAKYASLKALGFGEDSMRIIIVNDTRKSLGHAVLSVRTAQGVYILDNQNARPVPHQQISYYAPVSSFNASGRWINIATRQIKNQYNNALVATNNSVARPTLNNQLEPVAAGPTIAPLQTAMALPLRPSFAFWPIESPSAIFLRPTLMDVRFEDRR